MENVNIILKYLGNIITAAFYGLLWYLGSSFFSEFYFISVHDQQKKGFYKFSTWETWCLLTGLIGIPIHELGHAYFCLIFGHKIKNIKLFSFSSFEYSLGYVNHSYNPKKNIIE